MKVQATHSWLYPNRPVAAIEVPARHRLELRRQARNSENWDFAGVMYEGDFIMRDGDRMRNVEVSEAHRLRPIEEPAPPKGEWRWGQACLQGDEHWFDAGRAVCACGGRHIDDMPNVQTEYAAKWHPRDRTACMYALGRRYLSSAQPAPSGNERQLREALERCVVCMGRGWPCDVADALSYAKAVLSETPEVECSPVVCESCCEPIRAGGACAKCAAITRTRAETAERERDELGRQVGRQSNELDDVERELAEAVARAEREVRAGEYLLEAITRIQEERDEKIRRAEDARDRWQARAEKAEAGVREACGQTARLRDVIRNILRKCKRVFQHEWEVISKACDAEEADDEAD